MLIPQADFTRGRANRPRLRYLYRGTECLPDSRDSSQSCLQGSKSRMWMTCVISSNNYQVRNSNLLLTITHRP